MTLQDANAQGNRVIIAIPSYRRPDDLRRLLFALQNVVRAARASDLCKDVEVLVIDNDPAGSASAALADATLPVRYIQEHVPGVVAVRNRALDESAAFDALAFIDDDETPVDDDWLVRLLRTMVDCGADVVAGPVRTSGAVALDPWVEAGGFFDRSHRAHLKTGDVIVAAASNNLLLNLDTVRRMQVRFDDRFGLTGGEDSLFTAQLRDAGAHMVWCREAPVYDHLLPERQSRAHAVRRARAMSAAGVRVAIILAGPAPRNRVRVKVRAMATALIRIVRGSLKIAVGRATRSIRLDAQGGHELARGLGEIDGVRGREQQQYGVMVSADDRTTGEEPI